MSYTKIVFIRQIKKGRNGAKTHEIGTNVPLVVVFFGGVGGGADLIAGSSQVSNICLLGPGFLASLYSFLFRQYIWEILSVIVLKHMQDVFMTIDIYVSPVTTSILIIKTRATNWYWH